MKRKLNPAQRLELMSALIKLMLQFSDTHVKDCLEALMSFAGRQWSSKELETALIKVKKKRGIV